MDLPELHDRTDSTVLAKLVYKIVEFERQLAVAIVIRTACEPLAKPVRVGLDDDLGDALALQRVPLRLGCGESLDLLDGRDSCMEIRLEATKLVAVQHEGRVVDGVDVAEDAAGCRRFAFPADGDDDRGLMVFTGGLVVAHGETACLTRGEGERASRVIGLDLVDGLVFVEWFGRNVDVLSTQLLFRRQLCPVMEPVVFFGLVLVLATLLVLAMRRLTMWCSACDMVVDRV